MKYVYTKVTNDRYEFPVAMADSVKELAIILGKSENTISSAIHHSIARKQKRCIYHKILIDEEGTEGDEV